MTIVKKRKGINLLLGGASTPTLPTATAPPAAVVDGESLKREILEAQRRLTEEGSNKATVDSKILETEQKIKTLNAGKPPAPDATREREDLLAAVATEEATEADLAEFDREAAEIRKAYDSEVRALCEKIAPLESLLAGLRRKAAVHTREIERLRAEHRRFCLDLLMARCEEAGKEYAEAVTRAVKAMDLVITLASLHVRAGGSNMIGKSGIDTIDFPPLGVDSTRGTLPPLDPASRAAAFDAAEAEILETFRAEGIAFAFTETAPAPPVQGSRVPPGADYHRVGPKDVSLRDPALAAARPVTAVTEE